MVPIQVFVDSVLPEVAGRVRAGGPYVNVMLRCSECSALVSNPAVHDQWHDRAV